MDESKTMFTGYDSQNDITIIYEDTWKNGEHISTEIVGFYYGLENKHCNETFYGKLKAEF